MPRKSRDLDNLPKAKSLRSSQVMAASALVKSSLSIKQNTAMALQNKDQSMPSRQAAIVRMNIDHQAGIGRARLCSAAVSGTFGFVMAGLLGLKGLDFKDMYHGIEFKFFIILLIARVAISMVIGYLCYTLFGAAERLLIPRSLLRAESDRVSMIRTILGVRSPLNAVLGLLPHEGDSDSKKNGKDIAFHSQSASSPDNDINNHKTRTVDTKSPTQFEH